MNVGKNIKKLLFSGILERRSKERQAFRKLSALLVTSANREDGLFDAEWYEKTYPDVASEGQTAIYHYLHHGYQEGRDPGPNFDTQFYLTTHPDVGASGLNPLLHYVLHGRAEGRQCKRTGSNDGGKLKEVRRGIVKKLTLAPGDDAAILVTHVTAGRVEPHVQSYVEQLSSTGLSVLLVAVNDQPLELLDREVDTAGGSGNCLDN